MHKMSIIILMAAAVSDPIGVGFLTASLVIGVLDQ